MTTGKYECCRCKYLLQDVYKPWSHAYKGWCSACLDWVIAFKMRQGRLFV